jgi:hypothetical protein
VRPNESVALHVMGVRPTGNSVPDAGKQAAGSRAPEKSIAETDPYLTGVPVGSVAIVVMSAGNLSKDGAAASWTVSLKDRVVEPYAFVAAHLTVHVPSRNVDPGAGEQDGSTRAPRGPAARTG